MVTFEASKDGPDLPLHVAYCHDPLELRRRLASRRGRDLKFLTSKLGIDHGKEFLKETMTIFDLRDYDVNKKGEGGGEGGEQKSKNPNSNMDDQEGGI